MKWFQANREHAKIHAAKKYGPQMRLKPNYVLRKAKND
jgi:hypothetical protein